MHAPISSGPKAPTTSSSSPFSIRIRRRRTTPTSGSTTTCTRSNPCSRRDRSWARTACSSCRSAVERPWFAQRLKEVLAKAFGKEPLLLRRRGANFFVISTGNQVEKRLPPIPNLKAYVDSLEPMKLEPAEPTRSTTGPTLYSQYPRHSRDHLGHVPRARSLVCGLAFIRLKRSRGGMNWHLFFLGAAFMLLEVQVISKTALLFGTTWLVNSFVITAAVDLHPRCRTLSRPGFRSSRGRWS